MDWLKVLPRNRQRGSYPRCLSFVDDDRKAVARKLMDLADQPDVQIAAEDFWMPWGLPMRLGIEEWDKHPTEEAKLGEHVGFLSENERKHVTNWWLAVAGGNANTPNWDIASTCKIDGKKGLLLVEAKAHSAELKLDGKRLPKQRSDHSMDNKRRTRDGIDGSEDNHGRIGDAITTASTELNKAMPGWNLSRDSHYQLANRFAWAWKLASMDIPVVLIYLGFLRAMEMNDLGDPFVDCADWSRVLLAHSRNVVPEQAWGQEIKVGSTAIRPLIRCWKQELSL